METDWRAALNERLERDDEFREWFRRQPGRAAASIGMPFEAFRDVWAEIAGRYETD